MRLLAHAHRVLTNPSTNEVLPPYLAARETALAEHEQLTEGNRVLRYGLTASAIVNLGLIALVVFFATRPRAIPYVVALDKTGAIASVAQAVEPGTPISQDTVVRYQLAQFVHNARAILQDPAAMKEQLHLAYALARGQAGQILNTWYQAHDPFEGAQRGSVEVQIDSILKLSADSYEVRWTETPRDEQGAVGKITQWRGVLKVQTLPPDPAEILVNPLGLYITEIDWEEEQS